MEREPPRYPPSGRPPHAVEPPLKGGLATTPKEHERAEDQGDAVQAWIASGGRIFWRTPAEQNTPPGDEKTAGVQLCAHFYVPKGSVAFVKELAIGPYVDGVVFGGATASPWFLGQWQQPMGWEGATDANGARPSWLWQMRALQGRLPRPGEVPPGYLLPDVPEPLSVYGGAAALRLPGRVIGSIRPQRMQWVQPTGPAGSIHAVVGEDTTILLFAWWTQPNLAVAPATTYALGPSFGRLAGYLQKNARLEGQKSATEGWR